MPNREAYKSKESGQTGDEASDRLEADDLDECPREKTEATGEVMLMEAAELWSSDRREVSTLSISRQLRRHSSEYVDSNVKIVKKQMEAYELRE